MLKKRCAKIWLKKMSTKQGVARRRDGSPVQAGEAPGAQGLGRFLWTAKDDPSGAKKRQINHHNQHVHLQSLLASQTGLSPYLRFGCLSTRLFYHALSDLYRWLLLISMVWYDYGMIGIIAFHKALLSHRLWSLLVLTIYLVGAPGYTKPYLNLPSPQEDKEVRAPSLAPRTTSLEGILLLRGNEEP